MEAIEKSIDAPVTGMTCAVCAVSVETLLNKQNGVVESSVNFANESAKITLIPTLLRQKASKIITSHWLRFAFRYPSCQSTTSCHQGKST
ncbi:MAG: cation transporter [Spirosomataceae bacterium]